MPWRAATILCTCCRISPTWALRIGTLEELLAACADPGEEEIEAFRVEEGVAVFLAVDGLWAVYTR